MDLNNLREKIDKLDDDILELLNARMEVVKNVGELKKHEKSIIYRPEREKAIIDRLSTKSQDENGTLNRDAISALFQEVFAVSRNIELPEKIAFLGPEGSFTHQAAESRFGAMSEYVSLRTIKSVFDNVETGRVRFGVVPIENNQEGSVAETIDMLCERNVKIVAEIPMAIHFALAGLDNDLKKIDTIYSKDIAFRQCRNFLEDYFGEDTDVKFVEVASTSKAARLATENPNSAAICSDIAAKLHGLPVLYDNIEDSQSNTTRFLILAKDILNQKGEEDKTTILAKTPHTPGALVDFLQEFREKGINLTKIESRPARVKDSFQYWFLIDFDGHYKDPNVQEILMKYSYTVTFLGSYVKLC
ncbi:prephenate dehydratase [Sediminitomix flava]|uniref:Bifunctional chorismate mutase/prephenate dehydratase n=1 Tax=Sediminitomix flava TaxID=379075 RepID=A0A315ZGK2_SEDFL|nr:prephenate dehydratase [Sediminitomix flava]PWJ44716.1 chorismate mutase [Sediminitomix flava]